MIKLHINNVSLSYNHHLVVRDLSFHLEPGELVGLVGPNGCGKTTIIKALSRLLPVRSGHIFVNDRIFIKSQPVNWPG